MRILVALMLTVIGLAGCSNAPAPADGPPADTAQEAAAIAAAVPLAEPTLISTQGNRIAEFMVARNPHDPDHLVTAFGDYDSPGGVLNCAFAVSRDGGASWTVSDPVPGFSGPYLQFDGWVDFDEFGGVHAICLRQAGPGATTQAWPYHFRSADGGLSWSEAIRIPTEQPDRSTDKSVLAVGRDGTIYGAVSGLVGTSRDNGSTWAPMQQVEGGFAVLNGMVEDNRGGIHLLGLQSGEVTIQRTSDGGQSWNASKAGDFRIPPGYNDQNRWVDQRPWTALPNLAHDAVHDDLYVVYQSWDEGYGGYRLHLWRSVDGRNYTEVAVPDFSSPTCPDPCHVTHPTVGFDLEGRMGITVQLTQDGGHAKEVWFSASGDHGATWIEPLQLSRTAEMGRDGWSNPGAFAPKPQNAVAIAQGLAADPATAHNVAAGVALSTAVSELQMRWNGEYWGLTASTEGFVAMWIEHNDDGRPQLWSRLIQLE